jgi:serine/threonine-protein kinase
MSDRGAVVSGLSGGALHDLCRADAVWADRYEGWTELGSGGSATVVRTHSKVAGQDIALKVFLRTAAEDWQRFQAEVQNAQALASPYIVRTYSPFRRGSVAWIEMELVDGPDLKRELSLRDRPFAVPEALSVGAAVGHALAAAHEAGVLHRDVKPANVLLPLSRRPMAKLGDFGTSRLAGAARITHTGLLAGTPQFVAPEVVAGGSAGPASDVYGLTLCVYLMLSRNRFPFEMAEDGPVAQWLKAHTDAPVLPITVFNPSVPPAVGALLLRGLAKDPTQRPSAAEVAAAFEERTFEGAVVPPRSGSRRVRLVWLAAGAAVVLLAGSAIFLGERAPDGGVPTPASTPRPETAVSPIPAAQEPLAPAARPRRTEPAIPPPVPVPAPVPTLGASFRGELLTLANSGPQPLLDLRIVLIDSAGVRHNAAAAEGIAPGEELHLALDDFTPPVDPGGVPTRLEVTARDPRGGRYTFPLRLR